MAIKISAVRRRVYSTLSTAPAFLRCSDLLATAERLGALVWVLCLARRLRLSHIVLDFTGHGREGSLNVLALLG